MTGFVIFAGVIAVMVIIFRHWRKREMEAFLETDLSVFEEFNIAGDSENADPDQIKALAIAANVVSMPVGADKENVPGASVFRVKDKAFDDVHRSCLQTLDQVIDERFRVFVHVPIQDLARSDEKEYQERLRGKTLSFLVCDRDSLAVTCGIQIKGAGATEAEGHAFIEDVFRQIDKPLITLPMLTAYSSLELKESLGDVLEDSPMSRDCPKCGKAMMLRKATKGKNAGKNFWVCKEFPSCKGIMGIGG